MKKPKTHLVNAELVLTQENLQLRIPARRFDPGDLIVIRINRKVRVFTPCGTIMADSKKILLREKDITVVNVISPNEVG